MEDWGAIEEVLLLDAVEHDGFGNWLVMMYNVHCIGVEVCVCVCVVCREDIAAHVVTKTARGKAHAHTHTHTHTHTLTCKYTDLCPAQRAGTTTAIHTLMES